MFRSSSSEESVFDKLVHLNLVELVHPFDSPRIPSGCGFLPPETGSVSSVVQGKFLRLEDFALVNAGKRHLRRRDQPQVVFNVAVQVVAELGKVPGTFHNFTLHNGRKEDFCISMFGRVEVQHPIDQGPLKPGALTLQQEEAGTRQLHSPLEIYDSKTFSQVPMGQRLKVERGNLAYGVDHYVVFFTQPVGYIVQREVGKLHEQVPHLRIQLRDFLLRRLYVISHLPHLGNQLRGAFLHCRYLSACLVAAGPEFISRLNQLAAPGVKIKELFDRRVFTFAGQRFRDQFRLVSNEFYG